MNEPDRLILAEAVRTACIEAALQGYEDAGLQGLCHEGRWECAIEAIRGLDLAAILAASASPAPDPQPRQPTA